MTLMPSGGNDSAAIRSAMMTGEELGNGNFLIMSPITTWPGAVALRGRGQGITNLILGAGASLFAHEGSAHRMTIRDFTVIANAGSGSSMGYIKGVANPSNPADVSLYTSMLKIENIDFFGMDGEFLISRCMGGVTIRDIKFQGCAAGIHTFDCGEGKISGVRIENMRNGGWMLMIEGPADSNNGDHSAEDMTIEDVTGNIGDGMGIVWRNQGFGQITGCNITSCTRGPAILFQGTCTDIAASASTFGGVNNGAGIQQHAVVFDTSMPQLRGPHSSISFDNCKFDGSCIGLVINGREIDVSNCQMTANSNVDILLAAATNCRIENNTLDSTQFGYGSARTSIAEFGTSRNNTIRNNFVRVIDPSYKAGVGSVWENNRLLS